MELPARLRAAIDATLDGVPLKQLQQASSRLTERYRKETRDGRLHLDADLAVKAYLAARMPATFAAIRTAMNMADELAPDFAPQTLLDVGAGPGTALWAAHDCWETLTKAQLLETSPSALTVGKALSGDIDAIGCEWIGGDAARDLANLPNADVVTLCYVLDELSPALISPLVQRLWAKTDGLLLIVEPGTPAGWRRILEARQTLIADGAHILAPCPHEHPCPLVAPDWCHFSRRVARSRVHRLAKGGEVPWEDEKFLFTAAARTPPTPHPSRILAPPATQKGRIELKLCTPAGAVENTTISKRDADHFRSARRADWGDVFDLHSSE